MKAAAFTGISFRLEGIHVLLRSRINRRLFVSFKFALYVINGSDGQEASARFGVCQAAGTEAARRNAACYDLDQYDSDNNCL